MRVGQASAIKVSNINTWACESTPTFADAARMWRRLLLALICALADRLAVGSQQHRVQNPVYRCRADDLVVGVYGIRLIQSPSSAGRIEEGLKADLDIASRSGCFQKGHSAALPLPNNPISRGGE